MFTSKLVGCSPSCVLCARRSMYVEPIDGRSPDAVSDVYVEKSNCIKVRPRLDDANVPMTPDIPARLKTCNSSEAPKLEPVTRTAVPGATSFRMNVSSDG